VKGIEQQQANQFEEFKKAWDIYMIEYEDKALFLID
jgi:hypothetical protein